jgi:hypothetical protein
MMKSTYVDADGRVVCPVCGAKDQFVDRRSGKGKVAFGVLAPKRLRCSGCGTSLKRGDSPTPKRGYGRCVKHEHVVAYSKGVCPIDGSEIK